MKTLAKHVSYECKCKFDGRKCNSDQWWSNDKVNVGVKTSFCEKDYIWNPCTCNCQNGKNLTSIVDDSAITCDKIIETYHEERNLQNAKFIYFSCIFINYYSIVDSCCCII